MQYFTLFIVLFLSCSSLQAEDQQKIIIVRHAEADNNILQLRNSNPDHPNYKPCYLTQQGVKQAQRTAKILKDAGITKETVSLTVVSPLPRALQTASELAQNSVLSRETIIVDSHLIEAQQGDLEGQTIELEEKTSLPAGWDLSKARKYGGETRDDIRIRVKQALKEIGSQQHSGHIVIVTHGSPAYELHRLLTGRGKVLENAEAVILPYNQTRILTYDESSAN